MFLTPIGCNAKLLSLALMSVAFDSLAADTSARNDGIETIVVTAQLSTFGATKSNTPILETARSISIETSQQFIDKGALNLAQATSYMAGVTGESFGFATRGDFVYSRGLAIPRYRDSIQELFGSYNTTRANVYTIEQVELLKGPASVLYGQGSPGGIVNYVSKSPKREAAHEIFVTAGNFDRTDFGLDFTGPIAGTDEKLLYRMVALYRDSDTQVKFVEDDTLVLMPSLSYAPTEDTRFTLIGLYQDTDSDTGAQFIPVEGTLRPLADGSFIDQDVYAGEPGFNQFNTQSSQITFLAEHRINDVLSLEATALWRDGEADYHQAWPTFTGAGASRYLNDIVGVPLATNTTVPRSFYQADNESEQYAVDVRLSANFDTGNINHQVLAGVQYQNVETDNNTAYLYGGGALQGDFSFVLDLANPVYSGAPAQSVFDAIYTDSPIQKVEDMGFYISDQISLGNWRLNAGLRYDDVDNDDGSTRQTDQETSVSVGALYMFDNGLSPYLSYAESFETVVGTTLAGNQLEPEEGRQYEAGIKYEPSGFPGNFTLSYFDIEVSNLPNPNGLPGGAAQQQGVSEITGIEFESKVMIGEFYWQTALSLLDAKDPNDFELAAVPDSNASMWLTWRPEGDLKGFRAGAGVRYMGDSVSENGSVRYETPDYTVGDLMLGYEFDGGLDIALNVKNISDKEYLTSCLTRGDCFPGLRRTISGTARFSF